VTLQLYAIKLEIELKCYDRALIRIDQIAAVSPRKAKWLLRRGDILNMAGRYEEAQTEFMKALKEINTLPENQHNIKTITELKERLITEIEQQVIK
jgi:tetratricopeptide (TPR) repeat protein